MMFFKVCFCATLISAAVDLSDAPRAIMEFRDFKSGDAEVAQILKEALESKPLTVKPARIAEKINSIDLDNVDLLDEIGRTLLLVGHVNSLHPLWIQGLTSMKKKTNPYGKQGIASVFSLKQSCLYLTLTKDCTVLKKNFFKKLNFPPPTEEVLNLLKLSIPNLFRQMIQEDDRSHRIIFKKFIKQLAIHDERLGFLTDLSDFSELASVKLFFDRLQKGNVPKFHNWDNAMEIFPVLKEHKVWKWMLYLIKEVKAEFPKLSTQLEFIQKILSRIKDQLISKTQGELNKVTLEEISNMSEEDSKEFFVNTIDPYLQTKVVERCTIGAGVTISKDFQDKIILTIRQALDGDSDIEPSLKELQQPISPPFIFESWGSLLGTDLSENDTIAKRFVNNLRLDLSQEYDILELLGSGGFGKVFKVRKNGREYAMKDVAINGNFGLLEVANEIKIMQSNTPEKNLVKLYDAFRTDSIPMTISMVMNLLDGIDLIDYMGQKNELKSTEDEVSDLAYQILLAIDDLHSRRIVHLDIKPENIMYEQGSNRFVLIDYGLSATIGEEIMPRGTVEYMSPELLKDGNNGKAQAQPSMDFFSFGTFLVQALTGIHPNSYYDDPNAHEFHMKEIINGNVKAPTSDYSDECLDFLDKMLSMNPNDRFDAKWFLKHPFVSKHAPKDEVVRHTFVEDRAPENIWIEEKDNPNTIDDKDDIQDDTKANPSRGTSIEKKIPVIGDEKQQEGEEQHEVFVEVVPSTAPNVVEENSNALDSKISTEENSNPSASEGTSTDTEFEINDLVTDETQTQADNEINQEGEEQHEVFVEVVPSTAPNVVDETSNALDSKISTEENSNPSASEDTTTDPVINETQTTEADNEGKQEGEGQDRVQHVVEGNSDDTKVIKDINDANSLDEAFANALNKQNFPVFGDETKQEEAEEENGQRTTSHESVNIPEGLDESTEGMQSEGDPIDQIKAMAQPISRSIRQKKATLDNEFTDNLQRLSESLKSTYWLLECNYETLVKGSKLSFSLRTIVDYIDTALGNEMALNPIRVANTFFADFVDTCPGKQAATRA